MKKLIYDDYFLKTIWDAPNNMIEEYMYLSDQYRLVSKMPCYSLNQAIQMTEDSIELLANNDNIADLFWKV